MSDRAAFNKATEEISRRLAQDGIKPFIWNLNGGAHDEWHQHEKDDARVEKIYSSYSLGKQLLAKMFSTSKLSGKRSNPSRT